MLKTRAQKRQASLIGLFCLSGVCIYLGYSGWLINEMPAQYFGYFLGGTGLLGLFGVNKWRSGPLDKRADGREAAIDKPAPPESMPRNIRF